MPDASAKVLGANELPNHVYRVELLYRSNSKIYRVATRPEDLERVAEVRATVLFPFASQLANVVIAVPFRSAEIPGFDTHWGLRFFSEDSTHLLSLYADQWGFNGKIDAHFVRFEDRSLVLGLRKFFGSFLTYWAPPDEYIRDERNFSKIK